METILVQHEGQEKKMSILDFSKLMQVTYSNDLQFEKEGDLLKVKSKLKKLHKKGDLTLQQIWFGHYFEKEIKEGLIPDVVVKYVSPIVGFGIFANRDFKKMEFIAHYSGKVRKRKRSDKGNAYCFEYTLSSGVKTPFTIDAQDVGSIGRLINHSQNPNLTSALATIDWLNYVIFITKRPISKGEQLFYDYGDAYWVKRENPLELK